MDYKIWTTDIYGNTVEKDKNAYEVTEYQGNHKFSNKIVWAYKISEVIKKYPNAAVSQIAIEDIFE